jgi:hypothetical protein
MNWQVKCAAECVAVAWIGDQAAEAVGFNLY